MGAPGVGLAQGAAKLEQGDPRLGRATLEREALPADGQARGLALKGRAYLGLEQLEDAKANFAAAVEIDPSDKIAASGLVQLAMLTGDMQTADRISAGLIDQFPDDPDLLLLRAEILRQMDDSKPAVEQFDAVLAIEPDGNAVLEWLNKTQDANAAAVQPGLLLARYYIDRGDYLQALTVARNLSTRFPDNFSALEMLGRVQTLVGEQADAISTFDQILSTEPNDARVRYLKGGAQ